MILIHQVMDTIDCHPLNYVNKEVMVVMEVMIEKVFLLVVVVQQCLILYQLVMVVVLDYNTEIVI